MPRWKHLTPGEHSRISSRVRCRRLLNGMALTIISGELGKSRGFGVCSDTGSFLRITHFASKIGQTHFPTLIVGVFTLVLIYVVGRLARRVPSPLVGNGGGIAMMLVMDSERWGCGATWNHSRRLPMASLSADFLPCGSAIPRCWSHRTDLFLRFDGHGHDFATRNGYEVSRIANSWLLVWQTLHLASRVVFQLRAEFTHSDKRSTGGCSQMSGVQPPL